MRKSNRVLFKPKVYGFNPWSELVRAPEDWANESRSPRPATGKKAVGLKRVRVSLTNSDVGKDFTDDLAEEINRQLVASEADKSALTVNDEDRRGRLLTTTVIRARHPTLNLPNSSAPGY